MKKIAIVIFAIGFTFTACNSKSNKSNKNKVGANNTYGVMMGNTLLAEYPDIWSIEEREKPKWTYTYGLIGMAMFELWEETGEQKYFDYAKKYVDALVGENGDIKTYKKTDYNIDKINSGKLLFRLYEVTNDERYKKAIDTLRSQLVKHPRTDIGGFWHKKRYPHQMWLDGVYMGAPFYARYAKKYNEPESFDEIALWITNVEKVTRDEDTGLLYHGWDESREQAWADNTTGCSPHFWGRGMGWYAMALVDVLDYFPKNHDGYGEVVNIIQRLAKAIVKYQDEDTGLWYQVVNMPNGEGNYLEGSASAMFSYFLLKAVNQGYLDSEKYLPKAKKAYEGMIEHLITIDDSSNLTISPVCAVAGLGGDPYRDGSYEYYINEKQRDNDPKAVGPFILASLQYEKVK